MDNFTYEFLPHRGLTKETLKFYDIKTKVDKDGKPVCDGFKFPNEAYKIRYWDKKDFYTTGDIAKAGLFGRDKFAAGSHKFVTITEGEYDAPSLWQVLGSPCVSVQSSGTARRDCVVDREFLNAFERIYLALDGDAAGREAAANVAKLFDPNKVFLVRLDRWKDANDFLQHGEEGDLRQVWWNSKKYLPEYIVSSFADFSKIIKEPPKRGIPYPWKGLTDMTYGIRTSETVLLTAQEKVGKTELMHFIEYKLLKETDANVGAIYLEEPKQRHLQALAGIELGCRCHIPGHGRSDDEVYAALQKVVARDDRLHIYSHFGSDDPDVLIDRIRFLVTACSCRYVILDHLSMAVSGLQGDDERRALDYLSTRLEMLVKELDFALIMVCHVNDEGKTRGSRYPTKVADITITAKRDLQAVNPVERNTIYFTVLFNRFCGETGPAGSVVFHPETYSFEERKAANDNEQFSVQQYPSRTA